MFDRIRKYWKPGLVCAVDVETTGLSHVTDSIFGISITIRRDGVLVSQYEDIRLYPKQWVVDFLNKLFSESRYIVNHSLKFDVMMMFSFGISVPTKKCICSMVRASLIDEHLYEYGLDILSKKYLGKEKISDIYEELAGMFGGAPTRKVQIMNLSDAPPEMVKPYGEKDTELAYLLYEFQEKEIKRQDLHQVDILEREAFVALISMEYKGIRVDLDRAERAQKDMDVRVKRAQRELTSIIGKVNVNSTKQLTEYFRPKNVQGDWYIEKNGLMYHIESTKGGQPSWGAKSLQGLPFRECQLIEDIKSMTKTRDVFLGGHVMGHQINGRVYPNINQTKGDDGGTGTGRISYTEPALQQIPARNKETASIVRPIFLPEEGHLWVYGDLDQHEYRVFAHYSKSKPLLKAYADNPNLDVHGLVAEMTNIPRNIPKEGGANAKQLNLSIIFCMSDGRVAETLGLPYQVKTKNGYTLLEAGPETTALLRKYHTQFPGVKHLQERVKAKAKATGYIKTWGGRHIRFPRGKGVYKSPGLLFQGSAGDLNKSNVSRVHEVLRSSKGGARLLLNIHDEYSMSIPEDERYLIKEVQNAIQDRAELRVPIRIDFNIPNTNWWLATQKG